MILIQQHSDPQGIAEVCQALDVPRASYYRWQQRQQFIGPMPKRQSSRRLPDEQRQNILETLTQERFMDMAVPEVYYTLLDEGVYLSSSRTMYRILDEAKAVKERRNQRQHGHYEKPELLAGDEYSK